MWRVALASPNLLNLGNETLAELFADPLMDYGHLEVCERSELKCGGVDYF